MAAGPLPRDGVSAGLPVHHLPCGDGSDDRLADRACFRSLGDQAVDRNEDRPADSSIWCRAASVQERHADDGRGADPDRHWRVDSALVRLEQSLCLDRDAGDDGLRRHRLGRRLAQGGRQEPGRHAQPREVFLAVADRADRRALSGLQRFGDIDCWRSAVVHALGHQRLFDRPAPQSGPALALFQDGQLSAGRFRLYRLVLFRHRRNQQRSQFH